MWNIHTYNIHILAGKQAACTYRRDQNQIAGLAREYDYMGRSLMFFWSHVDVMENSKMLPSNRITHFSGPDHQPLPLAMPWYSSSSSYAPMAAAAGGTGWRSFGWRNASFKTQSLTDEKYSGHHYTPVSTTSTSNSCQGRFVINFQGKKVYQSNPKTAIDRSQSTLIIGFEKRVGLLHWTYFGSKGLVCYEKIGHICTFYVVLTY